MRESENMCVRGCASTAESVCVCVQGALDKKESAKSLLGGIPAIQHPLEYLEPQDDTDETLMDSKHKAYVMYRREVLTELKVSAYFML